MTINTTCGKCGAATRLVGIEPHTHLAGTDIWTFECGQCGHVEIVAQPLAAAGPAIARETASGQPLN